MNARLSSSGIEPIRLRAAVLTRHRNARRMDNLCLYVARPGAIAPTKTRRDPASKATVMRVIEESSLGRLLSPALEQPKQCLLVWLEFLERVALDTLDDASHEPTGLAHLNHRNERVMLIERQEGLVQIVWSRHGVHSIG